MPIKVICKQCGQSYNLKDELAGNVLKCTKCAANIQVPGNQFTNQQKGDPVFNRDKFLLRQKHFHLSFAEKYYVWNEQGEPILFVERPAHFLRNLLAVFAGLIAGLASLILIIVLSAAIQNEVIVGLLTLSSFFVAIFVFFFVYIKLCQKRHVTFYRDDTKLEPLMKVRQDKKFEFLTATYTMNDVNGNLLATFRKNYLYNFFRKQWNCYRPDGSLLCVAKEDSIILALLRRIIGIFFGFLRTNFVIIAGGTDKVIGEFNRQFTLLDRYVLDMSSDREKSIDRRIAVALGVMLDTGERR